MPRVRVREQPGTWVTDLTGDMGNTFPVLFRSGLVAVVAPVDPLGDTLRRPQVHRKSVAAVDLPRTRLPSTALAQDRPAKRRPAEEKSARGRAYSAVPPPHSVCPPAACSDDGDRAALTEIVSRSVRQGKSILLAAQGRRVAPPWPIRYLRRQAPVAQLDRALPSEGKGHTFESCRARHFTSRFQPLRSVRLCSCGV